MDALLAILFIAGLSAVVLVGALAIEAAWKVRMNGNNDKEG